MLTATATPGHTPGAITWHWGSCQGGVCRQIVYADSLTPVSAKTYRFSDHPAYVSRLPCEHRQGRRKLDCDILLTPHPSASDMVPAARARAAAREPNACRDYARRS